MPEDIREVLAYTREHFGQLQAERYAELIIETQRVLLEQPTLGRRRDDVVPGLRVVQIGLPDRPGAHGFLYRVKGEWVEVARLVHLASYLPRQIPSDF